MSHNVIFPKRFQCFWLPVKIGSTAALILLDEGFIDEGFIDGGFIDEGFIDEGFIRSDEGFIDEGSIDEGFIDEGFIRSDEGFIRSGRGAPRAYYGVLESLNSIGFIRFGDMAVCHAIYSGKPYAFLMLIAAICTFWHNVHSFSIGYIRYFHQPFRKPTKWRNATGISRFARVVIRHQFIVKNPPLF